MDTLENLSRNLGAYSRSLVSSSNAVTPPQSSSLSGVWPLLRNAALGAYIGYLPGWTPLDNAAFVAILSITAGPQPSHWLRRTWTNMSVAIPCLTVLAVRFYLFWESSRSQYTKPGLIESPRTTLLPGLSKEQQDELPYPPDALRGARDVDSPWGSTRVYEWGPREGRKVLLVHGISTPCVSLAELAQRLSEDGCRVMLFGMSMKLLKTQRYIWLTDILQIFLDAATPRLQIQRPFPRTCSSSPARS